MKNENSKECVDRKMSPENPTENISRYLGAEWDFWWPCSIEASSLETGSEGCVFGEEQDFYWEA